MSRSASPVLVSLVAGTALTLGASCGAEKPQAVREAEGRIPETIDFALHVRPILSDRCYTCHGPDEAPRKAGLRLDTREGPFVELERSGRRAVVPGSLRKSALFHRVSSEDPDVRMPPPDSKLVLTAEEIAILTRWIEQGAEWKPHWAFSSPERPEVPTGVQPIDHFVAAQLGRHGLELLPEADRETLLRRVTFDLTGLPPSLDEIDAFVADGSDGAYETVVDRLLGSPHYGERMATDWLDVARYADTDGYQADFDRDMSPWRDWVIQAFNENMPFDEFVTWQIAGDLLPNASRDQILASGFNRLHPVNGEGGIVEEEFLVEYAADRAQTFGTAFMGMTMECARCHDHKFDPITQREFYSLFSFFNNVDEPGQSAFRSYGYEGKGYTLDRYRMSPPTLLLPDEKTEERLDSLAAELVAKEEELASIEVDEGRRLDEWLDAESLDALARPRGLVAHYAFEEMSLDRIPNRVRGGRSGQVFDPVLGTLADRLPEGVQGIVGRGLRLDGDDALYFPNVGRFRRGQPFSLAIWVQVPEELDKGVIVHRNVGGVLYNFRGYHLAVDEGRLEAVVAHKFPYNALHVVATTPLPRGTWTHLALTYDGSSRAAGLRLFLNGRPVDLQVRRDRLYREILHNAAAPAGPGIKVGGRKRSKGFTNGLVDELMVFDRRLTPPEVASLAGVEIREAHGEEERRGVLDLLLDRRHEEWRRLSRELTALRLERNRLVEQVPEVMVMDESEPRPTFVLARGAYDAPTDPVEPGTPAAVMPFPEDERLDRLGLARWLTRPDHPLFARVTVNRLWQQHFGTGLVRTAEDFGQQGELPSHPALLDWLARELADSGWDVKALHKAIVTSATYRQSSQADPARRALDPENRLLSRGPSSRLSAEMLRDQALAASGLLVTTLGGPSVKPYQPEGIWSINPFSNTYVRDDGDKLYRRSLYTFWKRSAPPPTMDTFDTPGRSRCAVRRQRTSTPLQALALLNDPQFLEAARVLAERVLESGGDDDQRITEAFRLLTGRHPQEEELALLRRLLDEGRGGFRAEPARARELLQVGERPRDGRLDPVQVASLGVVVSTVMNHDASVTKR